MSNDRGLVVSKSWGWLLFWGFVLVILGLTAISLAALTTFVSVIFLGAIIFVGGIVIIIHTLRFWRKRWSSFLVHLIIGILYIVVGLMLMQNPISSSISLTLLLGIFYIILGIFRITYSTTITSPQWGWSLFSGILSLVLGILILASWPASGLFIIGLFVGIDLLVCGWAYMIIALSGRSLLNVSE